MEHTNSRDAVTLKTAPSLGMLNNDCLMDIFQFLQPIDYLNLAKTNGRLRAIADRVGKFKEINIRTNYPDAETESDDQLADILSMVGNRILSLHLNFFESQIKAEKVGSILEMIEQNCKKLKSLTVFGDLGQPVLKSLKTCIANNPGIENMFILRSMENSDLLLLLPELKSLGIYQLNKEEVDPLHLKNLNRLTRLTIWGRSNTNGVLSELAKKGMLEELHIRASIYEVSYELINSFEHLQILSVTSSTSMESRILPSKLKYLYLGWSEMSREALLSLIRQLKFLKELVLNGCSITNMDIVWSDKGHISNQWHRIAEELRDELNQRILTIHFWPRQVNRTIRMDSVKECLYESSHLKVLNYTSVEFKTYYENTFFGFKTQIPEENKWRIKT